MVRKTTDQQYHRGEDLDMAKKINLKKQTNSRIVSQNKSIQTNYGKAKSDKMERNCTSRLG